MGLIVTAVKRTYFVAACLALALSGCYESRLRDADGGADSGAFMDAAAEPEDGSVLLDAEFFDVVVPPRRDGGAMTDVTSDQAGRAFCMLIDQCGFSAEPCDVDRDFREQVLVSFGREENASPAALVTYFDCIREETECGAADSEFCLERAVSENPSAEEVVGACFSEVAECGDESLIDVCFIAALSSASFAPEIAECLDEEECGNVVPCVSEAAFE